MTRRDKLPNSDRAIVEVAKLRDYSLSPNHEDGKHKARVFASALGIRQADAEWLRDLLLRAASEEEAEIVGKSLRHALCSGLPRHDSFWVGCCSKRLDRTVHRMFSETNNLLL
jgi:hypothetical protein